MEKPEETLNPRIAAARAGTNPTVVCRVPSGWVTLYNMQYLGGYPRKRIKNNF